MAFMNNRAQTAWAKDPAAARLARSAGIDPESSWRRLVARDPQARFFYGVTTTGVFCRPACASRLPLRTNVRFFRTAAEAAAAGFRACKRCRPDDNAVSSTACDSPLGKVRAHLEQNLDRRVPLAELGRVARLSPFTVQRLFKRAMGVSPLAYQRALRVTRLRAALKEPQTVTEAIYSAGFGSSSRAYEAHPLGMTPRRFAQGGKGETIGFTTAKTPFGWMVAGATGRGLCWLALDRTQGAAEASLRAEFPAAALRPDPSLARWVELAVNSVDAGADLLQRAAAPQAFDLRGTAFQLRVWRALGEIPRGQTRSYAQLACAIGQPTATRAVARACAANRVAILVPCHRVLGAGGALTGYRWGVERKQRLLEAERG